MAATRTRPLQPWQQTIVDRERTRLATVVRRWIRDAARRATLDGATRVLAVLTRRSPAPARAAR